MSSYLYTYVHVMNFVTWKYGQYSINLIKIQLFIIVSKLLKLIFF